MKSNNTLFRSVLVVSDNSFILNSFISFIQSNSRLIKDRQFTFACHPSNKNLSNKLIGGYEVVPLNIKSASAMIARSYDLIISAHCKQIFPAEIIDACTCINIHPGLNPFNRGWYPQVFSIFNKKPLGATIHKIDEQLDHGEIIAQQTVEVYSVDNSLSAYNRVQEAEIRLINDNLERILDNTFMSQPMTKEGNVNLKKDFDALCEIDLNEQLTFGEAIDRLRALTHPPFKNGFFVDSETGGKVWISVTLEKDETR